MLLHAQPFRPCSNTQTHATAHPCRESSLLVDPAAGDLSSELWVGTVVSHEIAHQWFGNLVGFRCAMLCAGGQQAQETGRALAAQLPWTPRAWICCAWICMAVMPSATCITKLFLPAHCVTLPRDWPELWLAEGFASYLEYVGAAGWAPQHNYLQDFFFTGQWPWSSELRALIEFPLAHPFRKALLFPTQLCLVSPSLALPFLSTSHVW